MDWINLTECGIVAWCYERENDFLCSIISGELLDYLGDY